MNRIYPKGLDKFLTGDIDYINDRIICLLVSLQEYTPDFDNDEFLSVVSDDAIIATTVLSGKTTSGTGIGDADDTTFSSVPVNDNEADALIMVKDTGIKDSSPLFLYYDTAAELPVTPNGDDVNISWPDDVNKLFKL